MVSLGGGAIWTWTSGVSETFLGRRRCGGGGGRGSGVRSALLLRGSRRSQHVEPHLKSELVIRHLPTPIWAMSAMPSSSEAGRDPEEEYDNNGRNSSDTDVVVPLLSLHDFCPVIHEVQVQKNTKKRGVRILDAYYPKLIQATNIKDHQPLPTNSNPPIPSSSSSLPCLVLPPRFANYNQQYYNATTTADRAVATATAKTTTKEVVEEEDHQYYYCFYSLKDRTVWGVKNQNKRLLAWEMNHLLPANARCIGSSYGWLAYHNPSSHISPLYLFRHPPLSSRDFFSHSHMFRLPPIETFPGFTAIKTRKTTTSPLSAAASPSITQDYDFGDVGCCTPEETRENVFKVVLSSAPSLSSREGDNNNNNDGCIAVACINRRALAFCKLGDTHWTALDTTLLSYGDVVYSEKDRRFHALYTNTTTEVGCVETWDLTHPSSPKRTVIEAKERYPWRLLTDSEYWLRSVCCSYQTQYLVESNGDLYKVRRFVAWHVDEEDGTVLAGARQAGGVFMQPSLEKTIRFEVRKLDRAKQAWEPVDGIGDRSFFVGLHSSFSLCTRRFPHLKSNCIYFTDSSSGYLRDGGCGMGQDIGIFHLRDSTIEQLYPCHHHIGARINIRPAPFWVAPA